MQELRRIEYLVTTFFGAGYFPKAPGTFASLVAFIPVLLIPNHLRLVILLPAVVIISILAIPLIARVEKDKGSDPSIVVIDEVLGVWLIYCSPYIPISILSFISGITLFRLFDILKPSIIGKINAKSGAIYVLLDDLLAAVVTTILLHLLYFILKFIILIAFS
ncbi:MAG: phosphatidylglycerophosphatase A [Ignavibacteria bacterium]|jgi:phosphatidylglycerophosphatase A|nr:phosphatidylglycerophosphatase A [Ignavibacteria bacterium]